MPIKHTWKVVGGTLAAAVALGSTAAVAQTGNNMPDTIDLDDVVTIDQVTPASVASLFQESPTIVLDDSVASVNNADDTTNDESVASADDQDSADEDSVPSVDSPDSPDSVDSPASTDSADSPDSPDSPDSADSPDSPDSPDSVDSSDDN